MPEREQKYNTFGAAVFVVDSSGRFYVFQEKENKELTQKTRGQYTVVCETQENNESISNTYRRGLKEELGISEKMYNQIFEFENRKKPFETEFVPGVLARVYVLKCKDSKLFLESIGKAHELDGVTKGIFMSLEEACKLDLRPGVRNILDKHQDIIFNK